MKRSAREPRRGRGKSAGPCPIQSLAEAASNTLEPTPAPAPIGSAHQSHATPTARPRRNLDIVRYERLLNAAMEVALLGDGITKDVSHIAFFHGLISEWLLDGRHYGAYIILLDSLKRQRRRMEKFRNTKFPAGVTLATPGKKMVEDEVVPDSEDERESAEVLCEQDEQDDGDETSQVPDSDEECGLGSLLAI